MEMVISLLPGSMKMGADDMKMLDRHENLALLKGKGSASIHLHAMCDFTVAKTRHSVSLLTPCEWYLNGHNFLPNQIPHLL